MDPAVHLSTHLLSYLPTINKYLPTTVITCLTFLAIHTSQLTNYLLFCLLFIKLLKIVLICHANPKSEPVLGFEITGTSFLSGIKAICLSPLPFDSVPDPWLQCHLQDGGVPGGLRWWCWLELEVHRGQVRVWDRVLWTWLPTGNVSQWLLRRQRPGLLWCGKNLLWLVSCFVCSDWSATLSIVIG